MSRCSTVRVPCCKIWRAVAGADFGEVTFEALQAGAKKVIAVEIDPEKWPCLERTFAREISEGRVLLVRTGAWDSESTWNLAAIAWSWSGAPTK